MKVEEENRKKELSQTFTTLNNQQKDYILGLARALSRIVKKWPRISAGPDIRGREKEIPED